MIIVLYLYLKGKCKTKDLVMGLAIETLVIIYLVSIVDTIRVIFS